MDKFIKFNGNPKGPIWINPAAIITVSTEYNNRADAYMVTIETAKANYIFRGHQCQSLQDVLGEIGLLSESSPQVVPVELAAQTPTRFTPMGSLPMGSLPMESMPKKHDPESTDIWKLD